MLNIALPNPPEAQDPTSVTQVIGPSGIPSAAPGRELLLELDSLESWKVKSYMLEHLLGGGDIESFTMLERAADTIPPGRRGEAVLDDARRVVEPIVEACRTLRGPGSESELVPIDVYLPSGTRLIGSVRNDHGRDDHGPRPGPVEITVSKQKPKDLLSGWLNLLALTAAHPGRRWRTLHISKGTSRSVKGPGANVAEFSFPEDEQPGAASLALEILDRLVGFCRTGRHEAVPFFPATSLTLHNGKPKAADWYSEYNGRASGDGTDIWVRTAFDGATFDEITTIPVRPGDPEGQPDDRAGRYRGSHLGRLRTFGTRRAGDIQMTSPSPHDTNGPRPVNAGTDDTVRPDASETTFRLDAELPRGRFSIAASAGTGKTYALSTLAARYVAETDLPIRKLLIVTFTALLPRRSRTGSGVASWNSRPLWHHPGDPTTISSLDSGIRIGAPATNGSARH